MELVGGLERGAGGAAAAGGGTGVGAAGVSVGGGASAVEARGWGGLTGCVGAVGTERREP